VTDPLAGSPWTAPETVAGFVATPPNARLMSYAGAELQRLGTAARAVDLGCGAGRNAVPLAALGWQVVGIDLSWPMLQAAAQRARDEGVERRIQLALAPMERIPLRGDSAELIVAHGIWNLARTAAQFRTAVRDAARVARPGAALFVFTFSRHTLPPDVQPVPGEPFVFTAFSGEPQCFLTEEQLRSELHDAGFVQDLEAPLLEHNRRPPGAPQMRGQPVIYEGGFRRT
jgi:ubiquinone/menaquinone biosynthesis C-methylase UbiE